jgi:hypothetical protein
MKNLILTLGIVFSFSVAAFAQASEITGSWKNGSVGSIQYQNRVTGSTKPGRGSLFWYKFLPNGEYEFVGYMEVTMYNCTTTLFNEIKGRYSVDDTTINLSPSRDYWKNTNSCAVSGNKETTKTPTKKTLQYVTKNDEHGNEMLCLTEGTAETCYRKEKE